MPFNLIRLIKSIFACMVAAFAGTVPATGLFFYVMGFSGSEDKLSYAVGGSWQMGWWMSLITLAAMLIVGLPVQAHMQKNDETEYWQHALRGTLAGFIVPCVFIIGIFFAPFGAVAGFIAGSVFWLIRRPDKDDPVLIADPSL